ncbi:hypothetical protein B0H10DRAFT_2081978 [Mycena sp. CBHHK59/15]|nr:hypothetical protein B0H10DRAFT_2081978 [Mycena sp. CBHHK59/15]
MYVSHWQTRCAEGMGRGPQDEKKCGPGAGLTGWSRIRLPDDIDQPPERDAARAAGVRQY